MALRRMKVITVGALLALGLAACSNGGGTNAGAGGKGGSPADQQATVAVASGDLGQMLVDSQGRTLYMFLADTGDQSTCYGDCASTWPALTAGGQPTATDGVQSSMLGTTQRTDGSTQVTFDGHPLYHYASDGAPGDTNGEGIGGIWFVVSPNGTPIKDSGSGGGYSKY